MKNEAYDDILLIRLRSSGEGFTACNTEMDIPLERHEHFEAVITLKNNFIHTVNGVSFQPEVGDVVILRPQDSHAAKPIDDISEHICRDIYIDPQLFKEVCDFLSPTLFVKIMTHHSPPSFRMSETELRAFEESVELSYLYAMAKDYEFFKSVKRIITCRVIGAYVKKSFGSEKPLPESLTKLLTQLQGEDAYKKSIALTAAGLGYSPDHLNRLFKEYFGRSIEQYLIERRIYDSLTFLLQTDMPINDIAAKMGWECPGNYIKHFKKLYGVTPAKYRKEIRDKIR